MGTERRARQKANRAKKIEHEQRTEKREQRQHYLIIGVIIAAGLAGGLYLLSLTGDDETTEADGTTSSSVIDDATSTTETTLAAQPAVSAPEPGGSIEGEAACPAADGSSERTTSFSEPPPMCIDPEASYSATLETTLGSITVELDPEAAPQTVNNFVFLARYHYYDGSPFHRIIPGFVIQGGDATGDPLGTGNPGYMIEEEPPEPGSYQVGSLAMAKGQGPATTGGQFFIVTGEQGEGLPPEYSLFGTVSEGLDVVSAIEALPTTTGNYPTEEIYIESVTIEES